MPLLVVVSVQRTPKHLIRAPSLLWIPSFLRAMIEFSRKFCQVLLSTVGYSFNCSVGVPLGTSYVSFDFFFNYKRDEHIYK